MRLCHPANVTSTDGSWRATDKDLVFSLSGPDTTHWRLRDAKCLPANLDGGGDSGGSAASRQNPPWRPVAGVADWGLLMAPNRLGLLLSPTTVVRPVAPRRPPKGCRRRTVASPIVCRGLPHGAKRWSVMSSSPQLRLLLVASSGKSPRRLASPVRTWLCVAPSRDLKYARTFIPYYQSDG